MEEQVQNKLKIFVVLILKNVSFLLIIEKYKWSQIKLDEKSSNGHRGNHSAAIYKNFMIIFGGEVHYITNDQRISSEISSDIKMINLSTKINNNISNL